MPFLHANDAAMGVSDYKRAELDHYPTPTDVTEALIPFLLTHASIDQRMWEPACGTGIMSDVLSDYYPDVVSSDIKDYGYPKMLPGSTNFFSFDTTTAGAIVTNPPYGKLAEAFIRKALELTGPSKGVVAMLLRNEYDSASTRKHLFKDHPAFARKVILTWRPRWIADSSGAPRHNYAWFIWDWCWDDAPVISYAGRGKHK
jgi:predicted RNA methylase